MHLIGSEITVPPIVNGDAGRRTTDGRHVEPHTMRSADKSQAELKMYEIVNH